MDAYKRENVKKFGPAGIGCRCCNPFFSEPKRGKPRLSRMARRKLKQALVGVETE